MQISFSGNGKSFECGNRTLVMGIVNVTPDSFYDGGRHDQNNAGVDHGLKLVNDGADILDIGGESTRPGSPSVSLEEELNRVIPVIEELSRQINIPISVDTTKSKVARQAIEAGANIINDVSAGLADPEILKVAAKYDVPYVAMHMRGIPENMQKNIHYDDLFDEINGYFSECLDTFKRAEMNLDKIILDPGIGFGKSAKHNFALLGNSKRFRIHGRPLLYGPSRKSFMSYVGAENPDERLSGTLASVTACVLDGVEIVRVHDVAEVIQAVRIADQIRKSIVGATGE
jgi:dihydropteroate synthase